jgi:predicted Rossmann fold flavoprotein
MLFTHRGLSGPAILQISSFWRSRTRITVDLAPGMAITAEICRSPAGRDARSLRTALERQIPQRLASRWLKHFPPAAWTNHALEAFERALHAWSVVPEDTEGYEKAEVTSGGVDTAELSAQTMESRRVPGLYFIGEVVDVTGHLGGFNFQWAWSSAFAAGQAA